MLKSFYFDNVRFATIKRKISSLALFTKNQIYLTRQFYQVINHYHQVPLNSTLYALSCYISLAVCFMNLI